MRQQVNKINRAAECLNDTVCRNKYQTMETKTRTYKTIIRPIITYITKRRQIRAKHKDKNLKNNKQKAERQNKKWGNKMQYNK